MTAQWKEDMANCADCRQARGKKHLDEQGVCPRCRLTAITVEPNPVFPHDS